MNVLLDTATWINAVKEPETLPTRALNILRDETNSFFLSGGPVDGMAVTGQLTNDSRAARQQQLIRKTKQFLQTR